MSVKDKTKTIDSSLSAIGKHLRQLEDEYRTEADSFTRHFNLHISPSIRKVVTNIAQQVRKVALLVAAERKLGRPICKELQEEYDASKEILEKSKRSIYFPDSAIVLGEGGIYVAMDDVWLQHVSGKFDLNLISHPDEPQLMFSLSGVGKEAGVSLCIKLESFKLRCDAGTGVPDISLDEVTLSVVVAMKVTMVFNYQQCCWGLLPGNFKLELISFKGPYGLNKSIVSTVLGLVTPIIRAALVDNLPVEVGLLIRSLKAPLVVAGEFVVTGTELSDLDESVRDSGLMAGLTGEMRDEVLCVTMCV